MSKRSKSSSRWLADHSQDEFVRRAQKEGWRSRAVFKISEVHERDKLILPGMTVVDLGAAPGGWSQYAAKILDGRGQIFALDLLPMDALDGVEYLQGDFQEEAVLDELKTRLQGNRVDLVLSDMAPNMSGIGAVDQPRAMYLAELALDFANTVLNPGGSLFVKLFQGEGFDGFVRLTRQTFETVRVRKPKASRPKSREVYMLARNYGM